MDIDAISKSLEFFVSKHKVTLERLGTRQTQILELAGTVGVTQHYNASGCQSALNFDPPSASNFDPPQVVVFSC